MQQGIHFYYQNQPFFEQAPSMSKVEKISPVLLKASCGVADRWIVDGCVVGRVECPIPALCDQRFDQCPTFGHELKQTVVGSIEVGNG
jgi:hypothetical protein